MTVALGTNIALPISSALSYRLPFDTLGKLANYGKLGVADPDAVIAALFANSEQGVFYDPSDLSTMFQDSAGTTPVTADGQPVGLILDKSKGLNPSTLGGWFPRSNSDYISTSGVGTPLAFSGDFTLEVKVNLSTHPAGTAAEFLSKSAGATYDYRFYMSGAGTLVLLTYDSTNTQRTFQASSTISIIGGPTVWLKVTLDVDNGAGSSVAKFYQSTDGISWSQVGTDRTIATTYTIRDTPSSLCLLGMDASSFSQAMLGKLYRVIFKTGVDGTKVADFEPTLYTGGLSFTASTGELWTISTLGSRTVNITPDGNHGKQSTAAARPAIRYSPYRIDYDAVDDTIVSTFASSLGTDCTVCRAVQGVGASILTAQTIGTSYTDSTDHCGLIVIDRALTVGETADVTAYLNAKAGV